jgi:hypothetical protein
LTLNWARWIRSHPLTHCFFKLYVNMIFHFTPPPPVSHKIFWLKCMKCYFILCMLHVPSIISSSLLLLPLS